MKDALRFVAAGGFAVALVLGSPEGTDAKRLAPAEIEPIVRGDIRYTVPHFGGLHGKEQNGGYVQAWEVKTGKLLWDRMIYRVLYDDGREGDTQDVFITRIRVGEGTLRVENELGEAFEMDLGKGDVKAVVKKWGHTEVGGPTGGLAAHYPVLALVRGELGAVLVVAGVVVMAAVVRHLNKPTTGWFRRRPPD